MSIYGREHKGLVFFAVILLYSILYFSSCHGQARDSTKNPQYFSIKQHYGFILPHSKDVLDISDSNPWGFQLDWSKLLTQDKSWNNCYCYAQVGWSLAYFNYANPKTLGNSYNLIFFAEPYLSFKRRLFYSLRTGIGATYLNQVYDEVTNPNNTFYSSPLSFLIFLNFNFNYKITDYYTVIASGYYNHISNGGRQHPNKGINFPTFGMGLSYTPHPVSLEPKARLISKRGNITGYIRLFGTSPTVDETDRYPEKKTLLMGLALGGMKHFTNFNALNVGMELVRDGSHKEKARRMNKEYSHHIIALMLGHNLIFGRFNFNQQFGIYIHKPEHATSKKMYQRYELLYQLGKHFDIGTSIKVHGHVADNMDVRFGFVF